jgi:predicted amidophosphoribosyltransferase
MKACDHCWKALLLPTSYCPKCGRKVDRMPEPCEDVDIEYQLRRIN